MHHRVAACCVTVCLTCPSASLSQTLAEPTPSAVSSTTESPALNSGVTFPLPPVFRANEPTGPDNGFWRPFRAIPHDFVRFFSADTLKIVGVGGAAAASAHQWDSKVIEESQEHFDPRFFKPGNIGGGFLMQAAGSFGLYSVARLTGSDDLAALGANLARAQILTQGIVHAGKFASRRGRPDGSDRYSLPSGHTASAFATATVLHQTFGWKVGTPAYGFGAYVAASRMSANKHHLSDVLLGAALGVAAGRTVTIGAGRARLDLSVTPTVGGAALTFTKR